MARTLGYDVVMRITQVRAQDPRYNIGPGKVEELARIVKELDVKKVIFFNELKPSQVFNLQEKLGVEVVDRFQLILEIFAQHAGSREAKMQIELARLKYELPRMREWIRRAKMRELPGFTRGPGGYQIDFHYRAIVKRISKIQRELEEIRRRKQLQRRVRTRVGLPVVVLTGYTNAGKTTLFNRLAKESKPVSNAPFSTLATVTRLVDVYGRKILLSDTIGFIDALPPLLIESFYTTLEELVYADLLLLVVDASEESSEIKRKLEASLKALSEVGVLDKPTIVVLNKIDRISEEELEKRIESVKLYYRDVVAISAKRGIGIEELKRALYKKVGKYVRLKIRIPTSEVSSLSSIKYARVLNMMTSSGLTTIELEVPEALLPRVKRLVEIADGDILVAEHAQA